ncbi:MAG: hypothetical protein MPW16_04015 [Candidatus Manganitrophus sp.]|nr:MAG: hypothetical protein MPW16_04015 [Candidatus Manganitrophus sp.]
MLYLVGRASRYCRAALATLTAATMESNQMPGGQRCGRLSS